MDSVMDMQLEPKQIGHVTDRQAGGKLILGNCDAVLSLTIDDDDKLWLSTEESLAQDYFRNEEAEPMDEDKNDLEYKGILAENGENLSNAGALLDSEAELSNKVLSHVRDSFSLEGRAKIVPTEVDRCSFTINKSNDLKLGFPLYNNPNIFQLGGPKRQKINIYDGCTTAQHFHNSVRNDCGIVFASKFSNTKVVSRRQPRRFTNWHPFKAAEERPTKTVPQIPYLQGGQYPPEFQERLDMHGYTEETSYVHNSETYFNKMLLWRTSREN